MEILKFLLIVAIIVFAIVRQAWKSKAEPSETDPSEPVPDSFDLLEEQPVLKEKVRLQRKTSQPTKKRKTDYRTTVEEGARTTASIPIPPAPEQPTETDFAIRSAEEARKAIIWSEILNRKY